MHSSPFAKRTIAAALLMAAMLSLSATAKAQAPLPSLSGQPIVMDDGKIMLSGKQIRLWGIEMPAADQQCWQDERAWPCGEQAFTAFKHYISDHKIDCRIAKSNDVIAELAKCDLVSDNDKSADIADYMVAAGWAWDNPDISDGLYAETERKARENRKGIWTSRFQTPEDWRAGINRFIEYQPAPAFEQDQPISENMGENTQETSENAEIETD